MLLTGNPGGIGHAWARRIFVDRDFKPEENPKDFDFVQAKVWDNKALMDADPEYVKRLEDLPEDKRRAYLEGDWDSFSGQVFSEFRREKHTIKPLIPSTKFTHFLWTDWGYAETSAFAAYASALVEMTSDEGEKINRVITYKEWYGNQKYPEEWAKIIYEDTKEMGIDYRKWIVDPSMLNPKSDGSEPITNMFHRQWKKLNKGKLWISQTEGGSKQRIQRWATVHNWLSLAPDGLPYWMITENCSNLIRTLPIMIYDENRPEDLDTSLEDHASDAVSYGLGFVKFLSAKGSISRFTIQKRFKVKPLPLGTPGAPLDLSAFRTNPKKQKDWRAV